MFETVSKILKFLHVKRIDISRGDNDGLYLTRWAIWGKSSSIKPTGFRIYLHCFHQSDHEILHNHPWKFISFILWGGYYERTKSGIKWFGPGRILVRNPEWSHQIILKNKRKAWTIVIAGPKQQEWGFDCPEGWKHWKDAYDNLKGGGEVCD